MGRVENHRVVEGGKVGRHRVKQNPSFDLDLDCNHRCSVLFAPRQADDTFKIRTTNVSICISMNLPLDSETLMNGLVLSFLRAALQLGSASGT